jgi:hypothetical protein
MMGEIMSLVIVGVVVYGVYKIGYRNGWEDGCCREVEVLEEIWAMEYVEGTEGYAN